MRECGVPMWILPDGTESMVCPRRMVKPEHVELLQWWRFMQQGFLPADGGLLDQTAWFVQAMDVIGRWMAAEHSSNRGVQR